MKEELRPGFSFRSGDESGGGRRRRRGENRGQCKGKQPSRRDRENQRAFEVPPSAQKRFGPGQRISMPAGGNHQCAASNRPDTRQRLTRRLELDKEKKPCRRGRPHTKVLIKNLPRVMRYTQVAFRTLPHEPHHYICLLTCFRILLGRLLHSPAFSGPMRLITQSRRCGKTRIRDSFNAVNTARAKSATPSVFSTAG